MVLVVWQQQTDGRIYYAGVLQAAKRMRNDAKKAKRRKDHNQYERRLGRLEDPLRRGCYGTVLRFIERTEIGKRLGTNVDKYNSWDIMVWSISQASLMILTRYHLCRLICSAYTWTKKWLRYMYLCTGRARAIVRLNQ